MSSYVMRSIILSQSVSRVTEGITELVTEGNAAFTRPPPQAPPHCSLDRGAAGPRGGSPGPGHRGQRRHRPGQQLRPQHVPRPADNSSGRGGHGRHRRQPCRQVSGRNCRRPCASGRLPRPGLQDHGGLPARRRRQSAMQVRPPPRPSRPSGQLHPRELAAVDRSPAGALWLGSPGACDATATLSKDAMVHWAPSRHFLFHPGVRGSVLVVLDLCSRCPRCPS